MTIQRLFTSPVRRATAAGLILGAGLVLAGCSDDMSNLPGMGTSASPTSGTRTSITGDFNDADVAFAQMMIPHHRQAVQMSDMLLAKSGIDPDVTRLAQQIKNAQQPEIDTMTGWLTSWGKSVDGGMGDMSHGGGLMSQDKMKQLEAADAAEGPRLFLEGMIEHHQGAVTMAETEIESGKYPDAVKLAQSIVDTQTAEIKTMQVLLANS